MHIWCQKPSFLVRNFLAKIYNPGLKTHNEEKFSTYLMFTNNLCKIIKSVSKENPMLRIHTKPDRNSQKLVVCFVYIYDIHILGNQKGSHNNQQYSIPNTNQPNLHTFFMSGGQDLEIYYTTLKEETVSDRSNYSSNSRI